MFQVVSFSQLLHALETEHRVRVARTTKFSQEHSHKETLAFKRLQLEDVLAAFPGFGYTQKGSLDFDGLIPETELSNFAPIERET